MTGIERLVDIVTDGPYSGGMIHISVQKLREICEQIEREADDISGHESDVLAFVEEKGGLDELERRLMPEGIEWDGSVLRIRTAENVDYDGDTLFVLIGGRDE